MLRRRSPTNVRSPQPGIAAVLVPENRGLLLQFSYLQVLDVLSTVAFLSNGTHEANPLVRLAIATAPSPLAALLLLKACALGFALYCSASGRGRTLGRMNVLFALLVLWNLVALAGS